MLEWITMSESVTLKWQRIADKGDSLNYIFRKLDNDGEPDSIKEVRIRFKIPLDISKAVLDISRTVGRKYMIKLTKVTNAGSFEWKRFSEPLTEYFNSRFTVNACTDICDPIAKVAKIIYAIHEEYLDLASYIVVSSPQDENYVLVKCNNCYLEYRYEHHNNHGYSYDCYQCMSTLIFSVIAAMDD